MFNISLFNFYLYEISLNIVVANGIIFKFFMLNVRYYIRFKDKL